MEPYENLKLLEFRGSWFSSKSVSEILVESEDEEIFDVTNQFRGPPLHKIYGIVECISKGSPGTVYVVKSKEDNLKYALKKVECNDESDAINAFTEEMELKKMDHPYVVGYKDFFISYEKEASSVFINIISQYFEQGDLKKVIREYQEKKEPMPEDLVKKTLGEILEGVVYIHEKGIIHRNIKPSNIFKKETGAFVLGDLGVSTLMGDMRTNTRQTFSGIVYMAPEINTQPHDEKSDLYSVGGVLLNMLTTHLYSEEEFYKKLGKMKEDPESLNEILEEISETSSKSMIGIVQMLLRFKQASRPSTLQLIRSGFIQECMAQVDSKQLDKRSRQKETRDTKTYSLGENRGDVQKVLDYIADTIDHEACVADGLSALADLVRDNESAHMHIDQKARNLLSLAMWDNIFNKDVQVAGCYVLSNLVVFAQPEDILFTPDVITIIHKIMTSHEYEPEVQLAAVNLILALSADERASRIIVQLGGIHDILTAMRHARYHATLNAVCCMALWSLTVDSENLKVAGKENAVRDVCLALSTHKVSPDVCEAAAAALVSLLLDDGCYEPFNELDCTGNLVAAISLHTKNAKVVKNCCKVLATVVEANEECAYRFLTSDREDDDAPTGIPTVMEAYRLHKDNAMVVEAIVRLLLELSNYEDINVEMQAALIGPLLLSEVHKRYKENRDIMGPVEEALDRLGAGVQRSGRRQSWALALQVALPQRQYRFEGEVPESCAAMLRRWPKTGGRGVHGGMGGQLAKRKATKGKENQRTSDSMDNEGSNQAAMATVETVSPTQSITGVENNGGSGPSWSLGRTSPKEAVPIVNEVVPATPPAQTTSEAQIDNEVKAGKTEAEDPLG